MNPAELHKDRVSLAKSKYDELMELVCRAMSGEKITINAIRRQAYEIYKDELYLLQAISDYETERASREITFPYFVTVKRVE